MAFCSRPARSACRWLEFQFVVRTHAIETWVVLVALAFMGLGIWVGARLFRRPPPAPFTAQYAGT